MKSKLRIFLVAFVLGFILSLSIHASHRDEIVFYNPGVPYWNEIVRYSTEYKVCPYLIAALIEQESSFNSDAVSSAGAIGLTQIMPPTARSIAQELGVRHFNLRNPETSIRFGVHYLTSLIRVYKYEFSALRAYNGGPRFMNYFVCHRYANKIIRKRSFLLKKVGIESTSV